MSSPVPIPVFVGYDPHERAAVNVLIDSIYQHSSVPLAITPILVSQLTDVFFRERNPLQSTEFSFTRFPSSPSNGLPGLGSVHGLRHVVSW